jgi:hypothetical protein
MATQQPEPVLACNLYAIPQEFRAAYQASAKHVFSSIQEVQELPTGYAVRLPNESEMLQSIVTFISNERLCCPFFHFNLEIEPEMGAVWLRINGATDIKSFLQDEGFAIHTPK